MCDYVLKRMCKYLPLSPDLATAMSVEDEVAQVQHDPQKIVHLAMMAGEAENKAYQEKNAETERRAASARAAMAWNECVKRGGKPHDISASQSCDELLQLPTEVIDAMADKLDSDHRLCDNVEVI
jgi:hypothetical protein